MTRTSNRFARFIIYIALALFHGLQRAAILLDDLELDQAPEGR